MANKTNLPFKLPPIEIKLSEAIVKSVLEGDPNSVNISEKVQLLRVGTFFHENGRVSVTPEKLQKLKENFDNRVRGIDLMIDYSHENNKVAAGWIKSIELSEDGSELWADVDWTPRGLKKLAEKEYRYISPEFRENYQDNETLTQFGATLLGAGLTNRPIIKNMEPAVALSEDELTGGNKMPEDKKEELQEAMTLEQAMAMIKNLKAEIESLKGAKEQMEEKIQLAEKNKTFDKMLSEGKVCEAQREGYLEGDVVKMAENAGTVNLAEKGSAKTEVTSTKAEPKVTGQDAADQLHQLAEKKMRETDLEYMEALDVCMSENPKLASEYQKQNDAFAV